MGYCVQADVEAAAGGRDALVELTDQESTGEVNATTLDLAIADADAWINSYAQRRHKVPFASPPLVIRRLSAAESVYLLRQRRRNLGLTEDDRLQHDERTHWLEGLAAGRVSPGEDPVPEKSTAVTPSIIERSSDEAISRASLERW